jgi:putative intracellular protease/amidase
MKELGGKFEEGENFKPFVVSDVQLITGQNPASSFLAAKKVVEMLKKSVSKNVWHINR